MNPYLAANIQRRPGSALPGVLPGLFQSKLFAIAGILLLHVLLALLMSVSPIIATGHALATLAIGCWFALAGGRLERVVMIGAYIAGSEVLWRMTKAATFWEYGKYALTAVFLLAILRNGLFRGSWLALVYFTLLLPSIVLPMANTDNGTMRAYLSFNLSGPFALAVSVWFLSQVKLDEEQLSRILLAVIAPVAGIASLATYKLLTTSAITFRRESNLIASGGFGPNQVSALLGLAILSAFLYLMMARRSPSVKLLLISIIVGLATQSALTFSRTGLYSAAAAVLVAALFFVRNGKARFQLLMASAIVIPLAYFVIFPQLDSFTGGAIVERFQNTTSTGRSEYLKADLKVWGENPIFGIGPGLAINERETAITRRGAAHTEFSRLLAEHGLFGLGALLIILYIAVANYRRARTMQTRALVVSLIAWAFIFMLASAMRLAAPSFVLGLSSAAFLFFQEHGESNHQAPVRSQSSGAARPSFGN